MRRLVEGGRQVGQLKLAVGGWWTDRVGRRGLEPRRGKVGKSINSVYARIWNISVARQENGKLRRSAPIGTILNLVFKI